MVDDGLTYIFADWAAIVSANICADKGINVYIENPFPKKIRDILAEGR